MKNFLVKIFIVFFAATFCTAWADDAIQSQLSRIEKSVWGFSYDNENELNRIDRIEKQIFGITNPKITPEKRVDKITKSLGLETLEEAKSPLTELYVPEKAGTGVEYPKIDRMESLLLGNVYKNEDIYTRLERLEKKVFGAKQQGDLASRTDALSRHAGISNDTAAQTSDLPRSYPQNPYGYSASGEDVKLQLAAIENMTFGTDFSQEPVSLRLNRLENKIFQRAFEGEDDQTRLSRIQAAATASKTAKYYDNNKFQKYAATGLQAASFLLMILAFIL